MNSIVQYDPARFVANDASKSALSWQGSLISTSFNALLGNLNATETPVFLIAGLNSMAKSQLSAYLTAASGNNATFYYYYSPDVGVTWIPLCLYNTSTGELTQRSVLLDSGSYTYNSNYEGLDNIPMSAASMLLITGKSSTSSQAYTCTVVVRDN